MAQPPTRIWLNIHFRDLADPSHLTNKTCHFWSINDVVFVENHRGIGIQLGSWGTFWTPPYGFFTVAKKENPRGIWPSIYRKCRKWWFTSGQAGVNYGYNRFLGFQGYKQQTWGYCFKSTMTWWYYRMLSISCQVRINKYYHINEGPPQPENLPILLSIRAKKTLSIVTNTLRLMNTLLGRVVLHRKKCYCFQLEMQLHCYLILKHVYLVLDCIYLILK